MDAAIQFLEASQRIESDEEALEREVLEHRLGSEYQNGWIADADPVSGFVEAPDKAGFDEAARALDADFIGQEPRTHRVTVMDRLEPVDFSIHAEQAQTE